MFTQAPPPTFLLFSCISSFSLRFPCFLSLPSSLHSLAIKCPVYWTCSLCWVFELRFRAGRSFFCQRCCCLGWFYLPTLCFDAPDCWSLQFYYGVAHLISRFRVTIFYKLTNFRNLLSTPVLIVSSQDFLAYPGTDSESSLFRIANFQFAPAIVLAISLWTVDHYFTASCFGLVDPVSLFQCSWAQACFLAHLQLHHLQYVSLCWQVYRLEISSPCPNQLQNPPG